jgi:thiol-disulfide isomerase/thioredoxin
VRGEFIGDPLMKKTTTLLAVLVLVMTIPRWAAPGQGIVGKKGYNFELKDVDGNTVKRSDFEGKVVVLDFWAVWCGPCQLTLPLLQNLADKYRSEGLEVVGLHVDDRVPPVEEIKSYLEARKVSYTNLLSTYKVDEAYYVYAMPTSYILDRKGKIVKQHIGFSQGTPEKLEQELREVLGLK